MAFTGVTLTPVNSLQVSISQSDDCNSIFFQCDFITIRQCDQIRRNYGKILEVFGLFELLFW